MASSSQNQTGVANLQGNRVMSISAPPLALGPDVEAQVRAFVQTALDCSPLQGTFVERKFGRPTLTPRADFTVVDPRVKNGTIVEGKVEIIEVEMRPAGADALRVLDPVFRARLETIERQKGWPDYLVIVSPGHNGLDATQGVHRLCSLDAYFSTPKDQRSLALPRVKMHEIASDPRWSELMDRYVAPLYESKAYGFSPGWWYRIYAQDATTLPYQRGFVLKPESGTWAEDIAIWYPANTRFGHTKGRIKDTLKRRGTMLCQHFHPPMSTGMNSHPYRMLRLYYGTQIKGHSRQLVPIGGASLARNSLIIHGASDTMVGLLTVPDKLFVV